MRKVIESAIIRTVRSVALSLLVAAGVSATELEIIGKSTVDEKTLTFAPGPATRFGNTVNGRTHQQSPLTTYRGYQYTGYFDADRRVCLARRKLPKGKWQVIRFKDHRFKTNDSHNTAVIGICDADGTIHMAFDHHASRLNYRISKVGVAHRPDEVTWDERLFSGVLHTLGSVKADKKVTYPRFVPAPNGNLLLYYRAITSGNGHGMIEEYDGKKHGWTLGMGQFISRAMGTFRAGGKSSKFRCPYLNSISYAGNRLHVSWIWRDRFDRTNVKNQHSLCYAYSDDHGRSWKNSQGKTIGRTGKSFIHVNSPGLTVTQIPTNSGLSNQNTHYAFPDGSIHIMLLQRPNGTGRSSYHHHWRNSDGQWDFEALEIGGTRPKLVARPDRSLFLVYASRNEIRISHGKPDASQSKWSWNKMEIPEKISCYGEPLPDLELWKTSGILSIYAQQRPANVRSTKRSTPVDGPSTPLNVVDFRISSE